VTRRNDAVALAVPDSDPRLFVEHPFFSEVVIGIESVLAEQDLELMLVLGGGADRERSQRRLSSDRVDGVMLLSLHGEDPLCSVAAATDVPVVFGGKPLGIEPRHYVDADNRGGARQAVEHLVRIGRQRIATITGAQDMDVGVARYEGFRDALGAAGLDDHRVAHANFGAAAAADAMSSLLERYPDLDGVFVADDSMAVAAMRVLTDSGRRIPGDVAVVGFNDDLLARRATPPLTTVHQPVRVLGMEMARMLVALIAGEVVSSRILPTHLVVRESA
jgi:DNA-binding LacI/PurR family transcriptional regulator